MDYDMDPEVPCRNCEGLAKQVYRLKELVSRLEEESGLTVKGNPCTGKVVIVGGPRHPLDMD